MNHGNINEAVNRLGLSVRSYHRVLKIGRTIADLEGDSELTTAHVSRPSSIAVWIDGGPRRRGSDAVDAVEEICSGGAFFTTGWGQGLRGRYSCALRRRDRSWLQREIDLWERHVRSLTEFLGRAGHRDEAERLGIGKRLEHARAGLERVSAPEYLSSLVGTIGADPIHRPPHGRWTRDQGPAPEAMRARHQPIESNV